MSTTEKNAKRCPWLKGHDWRTTGYDGAITALYTCARCGWHKTFNGALGEELLYPPEALGGAS